jgi:hypothetical protein
MTPLTLSVTHSDGRVTRWGPDEPEAGDIPGDLTFSTSIPGGFKDLSCSLLRRIDLDYTDQALFDSVRAYEPGNRTVWEGRMAQFPRSHGDGYAITPGAVGHAAHLKDDPSFREVYVDRELSRWSGAPLPRRSTIATGGFGQGRIPSAVGDGGISWEIPNEALAANEHSEVWYDAGPGLTISRVGYKGAESGTFTSIDAATLYVSADDTLTTFGTSALTLDDTVRAASGFTARRYAILRVLTNGAVTPPAGTQRRYTKLAVYGGHGLALHAITGEPDGLYASDVIADVIARAAPLLTANIEQTTFAIPHLVFADPVTAEEAISAVNAYHLYEWGVYDNRTFFYRAPDPARLTWAASLAGGAHLDLEGDTAEQVFNGVMVSYQDATGQKFTVGPTGGTFDATSASLADTSTTNPATANGITRRWAKLDISFPTTQAGATAIGAAWLAEHSLPQRRGTLTVKTGCVEHPREGCVPVWRVRAGDYVRISDHPADVPRRIIETRYTHGTGELSCSLNNTSAKLDAILERIGVQLVGVF